MRQQLQKQKPKHRTVQDRKGQNYTMPANNQEPIAPKNNHETGPNIPEDTAMSYLTDSLTGILKGDYDIDAVREERLKEKHAATDRCEYNPGHASE